MADTPRTAFRLAPEFLALLDDLGKALVPPGQPPKSRTDVLREAVYRLAEAIPRPKKKSEKSARTS